MHEKIAMVNKAIDKVGGAFKLTVLLQKRVRELVRGEPPLVRVTSEMSPIDIALTEVLEEKVALQDADAAAPDIQPVEKAAPAEKKKPVKAAKRTRKK